jgi:ketosteroid isomerase-like protein
LANVIDRLLIALNAHDLEAAAALFDENYHSEQPAHPGRAFVGRAQMHANWKAMFAGIPDFRAIVPRSVDDGDTTWSEWIWLGTRTDGLPFEARGVTVFRIKDDLIAAGSLYVEDVEPDPVGIEQAVQELSGHRPQGD